MIKIVGVSEYIRVTRYMCVWSTYPFIGALVAVFRAAMLHVLGDLDPVL